MLPYDLSHTFSPFAIGIPLHRPRSSQEPFHSTLAVVNSTFPIADALAHINASIPVFSTTAFALDEFATDIPYRRYYAKKQT